MNCAIIALYGPTKLLEDSAFYSESLDPLTSVIEGACHGLAVYPGTVDMINR